MANELRWNFIPAGDFADIACIWQAICHSTVNTPLLSSNFVEASLRHFGSPSDLVCLGDGGQGYCAAGIVRRKGWLRWQSFQPSQMPLGPWMQPKHMDIADTSQSLLRALPGSAMLLGITQLDTLHVDRPTSSTSVARDSIVTGEIDLPSSRDEFTSSIDSKPFDRRLRKAAKDIGPVSLRCDTLAEEVPAFLNLYAAIESRGWKGNAGTALQPGNHQTSFYVDLLQRFAEVGQARMFTLRMGNRDVAAQIAIMQGGVLYLLKTTYEPELRSLGPGVMMHYFITLHGYAQAHPIRRIEYYGPLNESQRMWITGSRHIYHANTYRATSLASAHGRLMKLRSAIF